MLVFTFKTNSTKAQTTFPKIETSVLSWIQCSSGFWVKRCLYGEGDCGASEQIPCDETGGL